MERLLAALVYGVPFRIPFLIRIAFGDAFGSTISRCSIRSAIRTASGLDGLENFTLNVLDGITELLEALLEIVGEQGNP